VVGLSPKPERDSHEVAKYLQQQGYRIIPVNPAAERILGERSYPDLKSVPEPVDLVDVFRRPEETLPIARDAVAIKAKALWLQIGIVNDEAAGIARRGGLDVVMDRCCMVEHRRLKAQGEV
jgi:predicted CoA-binding protein